MNQEVQHLYHRAGFGLTPAEWLKMGGLPTETAVKQLFESSKDAPALLMVQEGKMPDAKELLTLSKEEKRALLGKSQKAVRELNLLWFSEISTSKAQLREKMAFFWHGHFACTSKNIFHAQQYLQVLRAGALGKFGDLVLAIAKTPAMLTYLNNQQNRKRSPNENFARELMELFTLGRGNYSEMDIKESARAFTGWGVDGEEYVFRAQQHDYDAKTFMGKTGDWNGEDIIKMILERRETAAFIVRKIYRFFVNELPDEKLLKALAEGFYNSSYDIEKLMREIFASRWFYEAKNVGKRVKSPVELLVGLQRHFGLDFQDERAILYVQKVLGQVLLFPPNVAGWAGGRAWIDSSSLLFRLMLPQAFYKAQPLQISAKEDGDVNTADMIDRRLQRFQVSFEWTDLERIGRDKLMSYLLARSNAPLESYLKTAEDLHRFAIGIAATPEYQLC